MLTFGRRARPDAHRPSQVIRKLGVVESVVDGECVIFGSLAVEIPLCPVAYEPDLSSLRSSRVTMVEEVRRERNDYNSNAYLRRQYISTVRWLRHILGGPYCPYNCVVWVRALFRGMVTPFGVILRCKRKNTQCHSFVVYSRTGMTALVGEIYRPTPASRLKHHHVYHHEYHHVHRA